MSPILKVILEILFVAISATTYPSVGAVECTTHEISIQTYESADSPRGTDARPTPFYGLEDLKHGDMITVTPSIEGNFDLGLVLVSNEPFEVQMYSTLYRSDLYDKDGIVFEVIELNVFADNPSVFQLVKGSEVDLRLFPKTESSPGSGANLKVDVCRPSEN